MTGSAPPRYSPDRWRRRAEEARAKAMELKNPESKREMVLIAARYDALAQHAERLQSRVLKEDSVE
jgi:hypothetical protein